MPNMMNFLLGNVAAGGFGAPAQDKVRIGTIASLMPSPMTAVIVGRVMGPVAAQQSKPVVEAPPAPAPADVAQLAAEEAKQAAVAAEQAAQQAIAAAEEAKKAAEDAKKK